MSAAMAMVEEVQVERRRFRTVAGALLWYAAQRRRRLRVSAPLEGGTDPKNREEIERDEATYCAVVGCLTPRAPEDWDDRYVLREEAIAHLIAYYDSTTDADNSSMEAIAHRMDMTVPKFLTYVRETRNVVRRRMTAREIVDS